LGAGMKRETWAHSERLRSLGYGCRVSMP